MSFRTNFTLRNFLAIQHIQLTNSLTPALSTVCVELALLPGSSSAFQLYNRNSLKNLGGAW